MVAERRRLVAILGAAAILAALTLPAVALAADPQPDPTPVVLPQPHYLVFMESHQTYNGAVVDEVYWLYPYPPEADDPTHFVVPDGDNGSWHYTGSVVAGPFTTDEEACPAMLAARVTSLTSWVTMAGEQQLVADCSRFTTTPEPTQALERPAPAATDDATTGGATSDTTTTTGEPTAGRRGGRPRRTDAHGAAAHPAARGRRAPARSVRRPGGRRRAGVDQGPAGQRDARPGVRRGRHLGRRIARAHRHHRLEEVRRGGHEGSHQGGREAGARSRLRPGRPRQGKAARAQARRPCSRCSSGSIVNRKFFTEFSPVPGQVVPIRNLTAYGDGLFIVTGRGSELPSFIAPVAEPLGAASTVVVETALTLEPYAEAGVYVGTSDFERIGATVSADGRVAIFRDTTESLDVIGTGSVAVTGPLRLTLTLDGSTLSAAVDGRQVVAVALPATALDFGLVVWPTDVSVVRVGECRVAASPS